MEYRYARWDGTREPFAPGADALLDRIAEDLFEHGDLMRALRELFRGGLRGPAGQRIPGLRDLMERLQQRRKDRLNRYDLDSVMTDVRRRLERIVGLERDAADRAAGEPATRERGEAARRALDALPKSPGGAIRGLTRHDFLDPEAQLLFEELLDTLQRRMIGSVAEGLAQSMRGMTPGQQDGLREMLRELNRMLRDRLEGREPDFQGFMERFGPMFGPDPPRDLDELLDRMQRQMAQMQSLLDSMSPEQRRQLMQALEQSLDPATLAEMAELGALMQALRPPSDLAREHTFAGAEPLTLDAAMRVMGELQDLDGLEQALQQAARSGDLDRLDPAQVGDQLGPEAERAVRELQEIARRLEEQGLARREGDRWELTPRTIRKLGEKALAEVFGRLGRGRVGGHRIAPAGAGGEPTGDTRPYEPGDPFDLNLLRSLMNALARSGPGTPVRFALEDFEVDRFEATISAATVLLLDQSSSMVHYGRWPSAKKVAMALQALIQGQFPRDRLFLIGFSDYAGEIRTRDLPTALPNMWQQGTNMHHALMLARRLLSKERAGTRQIIMVTDGDPTAHLEDGESQFSYPPSRRTILATLREVKRCTAAGIKINTFMLDRSPYLMQFVDYVTRINRGRAFFAEPGRLGDYVLIDYVANRRRRVG